MAYYNYHAMAKNLIKNGNCFSATIFSSYHHIRPALVLYFNNHKPIPIRQYRWQEYLPLLSLFDITINNPENINLQNQLD